MHLPLKQKLRIASYLLGKKIRGERQYPLALMLEPLFQCNLACAGCGKIDYPDHILRKRMSVEDALAAVDECGAPVVCVPGGEPLIHKEMPQIIEGIVQRKVYVYLCTNAVLLKQKLHQYTPNHYLIISVHLDGMRERHDESVCKEGVFDKAVEAIRMAKEQGFRVNVNTTLYLGEDPQETADFFDYCFNDLKVEGMSLSPGYHYEDAPNQDVFMSRRESKNLFRDIFRLGKAGKRKWRIIQSPLFLDFLAGNQTYQCSPWSNPTYTVFGWQKPCYLLVNEGYTQTFQQLMEETDWENYGIGRNAKCDNCMAHCGFEGTAIKDSFSNPFKTLKVMLNGPKTEGDMAPELPLTHKKIVETPEHEMEATH